MSSLQANNPLRYYAELRRSKPRLRRSSRLALVAPALTAFLLLFTCIELIQATQLSKSSLRNPSLTSPIVSLASSAARLGSSELVITLRSLLAQSVQPKEIRVYLPIQERERISFHILHRINVLGELLRKNAHLIHLKYVEDIGPATKFVWTIRDLLKAGQYNQPVVIVGQSLCSTFTHSH